MRNIRRMNRVDTAVSIQRSKMIRHGATHGGLLKGGPEDGVNRGIHSFGESSFVNRIGANVWVNGPEFHELGTSEY